jgi:hypothetical protein
MNIHFGLLEKENSLLGIEYKYLKMFEDAGKGRVTLNNYHEISFGLIFLRLVFTIPEKKGS